MASANEEDVVIAFRQALEEELRRAQEDHRPAPIFVEGESLEDAVRRIGARHVELEHEVALLRTIVLRLVSEPVDEPVHKAINDSAAGESVVGQSAVGA